MSDQPYAAEIRPTPPEFRDRSIADALEALETVAPEHFNRIFNDLVADVRRLEESNDSAARIFDEFEETKMELQDAQEALTYEERKAAERVEQLCRAICCIRADWNLAIQKVSQVTDAHNHLRDGLYQLLESTTLDEALDEIRKLVALRDGVRELAA